MGFQKKPELDCYDLILNVIIVYVDIDSLVWLHIRILVNSFFFINIVCEREFIMYYRKQHKKLRTFPGDLSSFVRLGGGGGSPSSDQRLRPLNRARLLVRLKPERLSWGK